MAINIDSQLLKSIQDSTCFGIAYDEGVPECAQCDVKGQCKAKSEGANISTPMTKAVDKTPKADNKKADAPKKEAKTTKKETKKEVKPSTKKEEKKVPANMPDFKPMSLEELKKLAEERSVEWKDYGNDNITRMRLIMVLKKSYE